MSPSESTKTENASLTRDVLSAVRYYLGGRRTLLVLAVVVTAAGLALNWNWLVAVGLAPILLSTLPCLVMCAFGVCMMCRSDKEKLLAREAGDQGAALHSSDADARQTTAACCHHADRDATPLTVHQNLSKAAESALRADQKAGQQPI